MTHHSKPHRIGVAQDAAAPLRNRSRSQYWILASAIAISFSFSTAYAVSSQPQQAAAAAPSPYSYADVADLSSRSQMVVIARIRKISVIPATQTGSLPTGMTRNYVEADVQSLIRGEAALARRIGFVMDLSSERRAARAVKGKTFILFGRASGQPDQMQLVSSGALLPLTPATETKVRAIIAELLSANAPPVIAGVGEAFHVAGTVAGEGETQIFLATEGGRPVSLSIIRRPDMAPRFGVALGEIVDEAAAIPPRDTLLWYRLACILPGALPADATAKLEPADANAAQSDYRAFMEQLGACPRAKPPLLGNGHASS